MVCFQVTKMYKNYREELLSVLWFLYSMAAIGNATQTVFSFFLLLKGRYSNLKKCIINVSSKRDIFKNQKGREKNMEFLVQ